MNRRQQLLDQFVVTPGQAAGIAGRDPGWTGGDAFPELAADELAQRAKDAIASGTAQLSEAQELLWASDRYALLVVLQAMDAAGKDSVIKHVMSGVNPQGVQVVSFRTPSSEELDHSFLWRISKALPERGRIGIFNRSYYEEVLVVRVHRELLAKQKLAPRLLTKRVWMERYEDIASIERYLARNGYLILKFFLNVSRDEQKKRFLERLDEPEKNWKFSPADVKERNSWNDYMKAYEDAIRHTSAPHAPWYVVPADNKWFTRLVVAAAIVQGIEQLGLRFPTIDAAVGKEFAECRKWLLAEKN